MAGLADTTLHRDSWTLVDSLRHVSNAPWQDASGARQPLQHLATGLPLTGTASLADDLVVLVLGAMSLGDCAYRIGVVRLISLTSCWGREHVRPATVARVSGPITSASCQRPLRPSVERGLSSTWWRPRFLQ